MTCDGVEDAEDLPVLDLVCEAPGCYLLNGEHTVEEITECIERWLLAQPNPEPER